MKDSTSDRSLVETQENRKAKDVVRDRCMLVERCKNNKFIIQAREDITTKLKNMLQKKKKANAHLTQWNGNYRELRYEASTIMILTMHLLGREKH